jgi:hypothetical protein
MKSTKSLFAFPALWALLFGFCLLLNSCKDTAKHETESTPIDNKQGYSDSSSSSVRVFTDNGKVCIQQSNTYYELTDAYQGATKVPLLLKIKKTELCYADSVNKQKMFEISAKSVMDTKNVAWNAEFVATDIQFKDNSLLATREGVDAEEDFLKRFSLTDGKEVFSSSSSEVKAVIPNVKDKRFIGYTSQKAVTSPLKDLKQENLLGVVRYGTSAASVNALKIMLKRSKVAAKIPTYTPECILVAANTNTTAIEDGKSIILMKADEHYVPADVKDFALKLTFYYGDDNESTEILIPVVNDQLNLQGAKFDREIFDIQPL